MAESVCVYLARNRRRSAFVEFPQFGGHRECSWTRRGDLGEGWHDTPEARRAEKTVATGMLRSVSAGYSVERWSVSDSTGNTIDPEDARWMDADDLILTAEEWTLIEVSLVATLADKKAMIRSQGDGHDIGHRRATIARTRMRQRTIDIRSQT